MIIDGDNDNGDIIMIMIKSAGRTASNREKYVSEPKRIEPNRFLPEKAAVGESAARPAGTL